MTNNQPANLFLIPSFISQDLSPDGVHLTAVSGLHYLLHLFDQSEAILALDPREPELKLVKVQESVRQHDDRLSYLESRHGGLHESVCLKTAIDHEFKDWMTNRSEENWLTIIGLPRLGQMTPREWQNAVRKQVASFIKEFLNINRVRLDYSVEHVTNPVKGRTAGKSVLNVRMNSVHTSERIRDVWSGFFRRANPAPLPGNYKGISVRNTVTLATRIRIRILQQFANNYVASNPGGSAKVRGYESRPLLTTIPPRGSPSPYQRTFNFIQACTTLPAMFSDDGLAQIFQIVGTHFKSELRSVFIVLRDDDRDRCEALVKNYQPRNADRGRSAAPTASSHFSGTFSGPGAGMEVQSELLRQLRSPPPPPPPPRSSSLAPATRVRERSASDSSHRDPRSKQGLKRARLSSEESVGRKRRRHASETESSQDDRQKKKSKSKYRSKGRSYKGKSRGKGRSRRRRYSSSSSSSSSDSASGDSGTDAKNER